MERNRLSTSRYSHIAKITVDDKRVDTGHFDITYVTYQFTLWNEDDTVVCSGLLIFLFWYILSKMHVLCVQARQVRHRYSELVDLRKLLQNKYKEETFRALPPKRGKLLNSNFYIERIQVRKLSYISIVLYWCGTACLFFHTMCREWLHFARH